MIPVSTLQTLQRRYGSADWLRWEAYRWQEYDYVRYPAAGATQLRFFSVPLGGADPTSGLLKTTEQTNLGQGGNFGQVYFIIQQIRVHFFFLPKNRQPTGINDDADLIYTTLSNAMSKYLEVTRRGVLNISILAKKYFDIERPLVTAPPGFGVTIQQHAGTFDAAGFANFSIFAQQNPNAGCVYDVNPPQVVEPANAIDVTIDWPTTSPVFTGLVNSADPRLDLGVIFDGYIVRPAA